MYDQDTFSFARSAHAEPAVAVLGRTAIDINEALMLGYAHVALRQTPAPSRRHGSAYAAWDPGGHPLIYAMSTSIGRRAVH